MAEIDIKNIPNDILENFFENYIKKFFEDNWLCKVEYKHEFVPFKYDQGPSIYFKLQYISGAGIFKIGSVILTPFNCLLCVDDSSSKTPFQKIHDLSMKWQMVLENYYGKDYTEWLDDYNMSENDTIFK